MSTLTTAGIIFGDSSVQNTAATAISTANVMSAVAGQTYLGVGTIGSFMSSNTTLAYPGTSVSGNKLFYISNLVYVSAFPWSGNLAEIYPIGNRLNVTASFNPSSTSAGGNGTVFTCVTSGTWRVIGTTTTAAIFDSCGNQTKFGSNLYIRIA
ncbi:hypothetical protein UFOVP924_46 [uncultured Caudovirales phage]|uniref:Uncharacterized protein n=1 Tax=uncultured Caudovirales phage TaxID=2100421 RepID=A0A6J5RRK2_9CAUD|nr:hypothetical protein UFOVP924_46 [uncultured Caudovirales phage]CAB4199903.1 hypothetical protein UFOVP1348_17 [uncultured Caudovirales phage]